MPSLSSVLHPVSISIWIPPSSNSTQLINRFLHRPDSKLNLPVYSKHLPGKIRRILLNRSVTAIWRTGERLKINILPAVLMYQHPVQKIKPMIFPDHHSQKQPVINPVSSRDHHFQKQLVWSPASSPD